MIGPPTRLNHDTGNANSRGFAGMDRRFDGHAPATRQAGAVMPSADVETRRPPGAADGAPKRLQAAHAQVSPSGDLCRLLSLLADKTRLRILRILAGGERPVVALTGELRLPQPTVSHHLAWLRMMDLVSPRRQGKHVFYALGAAAACDESGMLTLTANDATVTITPIPAE